MSILFARASTRLSVQAQSVQYRPMDTTFERLAKRAICIADGCMRSDVECFGQELSGPGQYALTNEDREPVRRLRDASWRPREAVGYLRERSLLTLSLAPEGIVVTLHQGHFDE